ncbi:DUF362 domain-containing protein [Methanocorpusculum parvum]|uniref:4Fe-4S ferredoxin-type domain-containing protein n=1 Tax=Methanocorpusculum parvum TaxID=2193 RepID=A0AAX0Q9X1_9EURY|nr:DUF362 domain-containing protein [Methanocorpusculum parvum]MDD2248581.1 DUF362 domain-containing protein [Methanocorpusculum sp.]MDD2802636.1 DUF362 domain-containing protein [Methanocorpusculum sp.]PAV09695.1 hypothetical protein ASJ83_05660 [Methanocorpusculum parvum]HJJ37472.1 DUF362 domain-containing protein [Methanocorpusculum sp.]
MNQITGSAQCSSYDREEVCRAVERAVEAAGGLPDLAGKKVLLKPNLLSDAGYEKAVSTHPEVVFAVGKLIIDAGGILMIADSPGAGILYTPRVMKRVYQKCGITQVAGDLGVAMDPETGSKDRSYPEGKVMKHFTVIDPACEADVIISVCKLKTHIFTRFSGAVKNTFGVVPGLDKPVFHSRFPDPADFSEMLVDLNELIKPDFVVMDAVFGMEGNGPMGGEPRRVGYILASKSVYALDVTAQKLISMDPLRIQTTAAAAARGLVDPARVVTAGDLVIPLTDFVLPSTYTAPSRNTWFRRNVLRRFQTMGKYYAPAPVVKKDICVGCGQCVRICPVGAAVMKDRKAGFDHSKCIRCYCCHEMCQYHAIEMKRSAAGRFLHMFLR